jgi:hypothetical protein
MNEELPEKLKHWKGCEETDISHVGYIGNKFQLGMKESGVPELWEQKAGRGYQ